ncbi:lysine/ornithine N-monooxygenase [Embleya hyalina]|uniref:L-lysine N6-monooxygenase MbtG n=1 Tax=Embleya hyalina TaxID=516124 RepID=A0A401Z1A1_9ACTN|nr:lysine/ornithine N-monooxygenase [Embleya hyalina]
MIDHLRDRGSGALFLEKQPEFGRHRGMLVDGATMQVSFLEDLATMRNPTTDFGFVAYPHSIGRLVDFVNHKVFFPLRAEFHGYLEWAAARVSHQVRYGAEVVAVEPVPTDGEITAYNVVVAGDPRGRNPNPSRRFGGTRCGDTRVGKRRSARPHRALGGADAQCLSVPASEWRYPSSPRQRSMARSIFAIRRLNDGTHELSIWWQPNRRIVAVWPVSRFRASHGMALESCRSRRARSRHAARGCEAGDAALSRVDHELYAQGADPGRWGHQVVPVIDSCDTPAARRMVFRETSTVLGHRGWPASYTRRIRQVRRRLRGSSRSSRRQGAPTPAGRPRHDRGSVRGIPQRSRRPRPVRIHRACNGHGPRWEVRRHAIDVAGGHLRPAGAPRRRKARRIARQCATDTRPRARPTSGSASVRPSASPLGRSALGRENQPGSRSGATPPSPAEMQPWAWDFRQRKDNAMTLDHTNDTKPQTSSWRGLLAAVARRPP